MTRSQASELLGAVMDPWHGSGSHGAANVDSSTDCTDWLLCHIILGLSDSLTSGDINTSNRQAGLNWLFLEFSLAIDHNGKKLYLWIIQNENIHRRNQ